MKLDQSYLKDLRKERGINQTALALFLWVTKSFISKMETNVNRIAPKNIKKISKFLQLSKLERMKLEISAGLMPKEIIDLMPNDLLLKVFLEIAEAPISQKEKERLADNFNASIEYLLRLQRRIIENIISGKKILGIK